MPENDSLEILLIEDNSADAALIKANLRVGLGKVGVAHANRLKDAIDTLATRPVGVVLLDLNLPDSSGLSTFHQLTAKSHGVPVVILSGMDDADTAVKAVAAGADDYVQKNSCDPHTLARSVRFAIERSTRLKAERELYQVRSELNLAQSVQDSLYPQRAPELPGFEIAYGIQSAGFGCGDYFDFVPLNDGRTLIVVGDVAGHGMGPAMVMAETRACLHTLADQNAAPSAMLPSMNRLIHAAKSGGMFVTLMLVVFDPQHNTFEYFNAGHPGWVSRTIGAQRLTTHQIPLGMLLDVDYSQSDKVTLNSGDILIIPTDGIPETPNGSEMFGTQRTLETVAKRRDQHAAEIVDGLFAEAIAFSNGQPQADDMTIVIVKAL